MLVRCEFYMILRPWIEDSKVCGNKEEFWVRGLDSDKVAKNTFSFVAKNTNLEIPYGHCTVNSCSAEFATISFVSFIYRHLAAKQKLFYKTVHNLRSVSLHAQFDIRDAVLMQGF